jgi:prepilin-type N-terminal cleavage/methylation domain-containing protein
MNRNKKGFTLVELLVVIGILGILMGALFPAISSAMVKANLSACGMRGRNLFVAITAANTEREALGLGIELGNVIPQLGLLHGRAHTTTTIYILAYGGTCGPCPAALTLAATERKAEVAPKIERGEISLAGKGTCGIGTLYCNIGSQQRVAVQGYSLAILLK